MMSSSFDLVVGSLTVGKRD